jgi:hypothetical protein
MKRQSRSVWRVPAACLKVSLLLASFACGRIDLGPQLESDSQGESEGGRPQSYPPPQIILGPPTTRVELGPGRGSNVGVGPLGGDDVTAPLEEPDASPADAAPAPGASAAPGDAGLDAEAP